MLLSDRVALQQIIKNKIIMFVLIMPKDMLMSEKIHTHAQPY